MRTFSLFFLILSLFFCGPYEPKEGLQIALPSDPTSLDPLYSTDLVSQKLAKYIHRGLYNWDNQKLESSWVKEYKTKIEHGNQSIEFTLSESSPPVNDIIFSLSRLIFESFPRKSDFDFIKEIKFINENKFAIVFHHKLTDGSWKEKLALPFASIISKSKYEDEGKFDGFGKYEVTEWKKNEYLNLILRETSEHFPKKMKFLILPQSSTSLFLFRKQRLDGFKLSDFLLSIPEATSESTIIKKGRSVQYVTINGNNPCFDKNFRLALNYAIPKELIISKLLENKADLTYGPIPIPYFQKKFKSKEFNSYSYDPSKAKYFLSKSTCFPKVLTMDFEFRMRGDDENQAKGKAILQALTDLGLRFTIKQMEKAPLYKENGEGKGDLTLLTWYSDYDSIWNFLDPLFHPNKLGNGGNRGFYKNNDLISYFELKDQISETKTLELIQKIYEDVPWIFLWSIQENYLVSKGFLQYSALYDYL